MAPKLREVDLPVCPTCGLIGAQPTGARRRQRRMKYACQGPAGEPHKLTRMEPVRFREVRQ